MIKLLKGMFIILLCMVYSCFCSDPANVDGKSNEKQESNITSYVTFNMGRANYSHTSHLSDEDRVNTRKALQNEHFRMAVEAALTKESLLPDEKGFYIRNSITAPYVYRTNDGISYTDLVGDKIIAEGDWKTFALYNNVEGFLYPEVCRQQIELAKADGIEFPVTLDFPYLGGQEEADVFTGFYNSLYYCSDGQIIVNLIGIGDQDEFNEMIVNAAGPQKDCDISCYSSWHTVDLQPYGYMGMVEDGDYFGLKQYGDNAESDVIWENSGLSEICSFVKSSRTLFADGDIAGSYEAASDAEARLLGKAFIIPVSSSYIMTEYAVLGNDGVLTFLTSPYDYEEGTGIVERLNEDAVGPGYIYRKFWEEDFVSPWQGSEVVEEVVVDGISVDLATCRDLFADCVNLKKVSSVNGGKINTEQVTDFSGMFKNCTSLRHLDLAEALPLSTGKAENMKDMFAGCTSLARVTLGKGMTVWHEDALLPDHPWENIRINERKTAAELRTQYPENCDEWCGTWEAVLDTVVPCAVLNSDKELIFFNTNRDYESFTEGLFSDVLGNRYEGKLFHTEQFVGDLNEWHLEHDMKTVRVAEGQTVKVTFLMFRGIKLESFYGKGFDTSAMTDMSYMFSSCTKLKYADLTGFDTSNVATMAFMFQECNALTDVNVSSFNTAQVTSMREMFSHCTKLNYLDISSFDTSAITNMDYMFYKSGITTIKLGPKFTTWNSRAVLNEGWWKHGNLRLTEEDLLIEYPSHAAEWAGEWTWKAYETGRHVITDLIYKKGKLTIKWDVGQDVGHCYLRCIVGDPEKNASKRIVTTNKSYGEYVYKNIKANTPYFYYVEINKGMGRIEYSAKELFYLTNKPTLTVKAEAYNRIRITLSKKTKGLNSYVLIRGTNKDFDDPVVFEMGNDGYVDTDNIEPGKTYYYAAYAHGEIYDYYVASDESATVSVKTSLSKPAISALKQIESNEVKVSYGAVDGADYYQILRSTNAKKGYAVIGTSDTTEFVDDKTLPGKTYYYQVKAVRMVEGKEVLSAASANKSIKTAIKAPKLTSVTTDPEEWTMTVNWTENEFDVMYELYQSLNAKKSFKLVGTFDELQGVFAQATSGKKYYFKVRAVAEIDGKKYYSAYSNVLNKTLSLGKPTISTVIAKPEVEPNLVEITYSKVEGATSYKILRSTNKKKGFKEVGETSELVFQDHATPGKTYYYQVKAVKETESVKVVSVASAVKSVKVPAMKAPAELVLSLDAENKALKLDWADHQYEVSYEVEYSLKKNKGFKAAIKELDESEFAFVVPTAGKTYYFRVRACYKDVKGNVCYSGYSAVKSIKASF
ncbi:MAG: BspA family leucine-rich repeat surface protein [Erysipelotrichaceae bacterium]|nr:BspA family leucine-rich repeat surface protein [Erysipelotrichaceae bacterium]